MKVYTGMDPRLPLRDIPAHARRAEAAGYDGLQVAETVHDAFAAALLALEHTERITVRTSVALAFVRSPMLTAYTAWDLSKFSGGRFHLGLGTQIKQNIEDRYGMPWSEPAARMRDYVGAVRAAFTSFRTGERPAFEGEHYRITRLQPYFNPGPDETTPEPPVYLGGVNRRMCALAGELADGFVTHPTNSSPRYLESVCRPGLAEGEAQRTRAAGLELVAGTQVIAGGDKAGLDAERARQRRLFAFLYSTPAYRRTLELYGWADMQERLAAMVRDNRWDDLHTVVTDEVLDTLVPMAVYEELPELILSRWGGGLADGVTVPLPVDPAHDGRVAEVVKALQAAG